jgi:hypothetical protein
VNEPKDEYYSKNLAEPSLLEGAVRFELEGNGVSLLVPVGKLRRGGDEEFVDRSDAQKAFALLEGRDGFPNLRIIDCHLNGAAKPANYFLLRWGDPPPFDGCDWTDPMCALLLGLHYGYTEKAVAKQFEYYLTFPRRSFTRKEITGLIRSVRSVK